MRFSSALLSAGALALSLALSPALSGCGSVASQSSEPGPVTFKADDAPSEGATVYLRAMPSIGDLVVLDVVARGAHDLHGVAFRVTYDPDVLAFSGNEVGGSWSKGALSLAKEAAPGQLLVTWSEKGEVGIDASKDTVLGTLSFQAKGRKASPIAFKVERSQIVDKRGTKIASSWRGGTLAAR